MRAGSSGPSTVEAEAEFVVGTGIVKVGRESLA